MMAISDYARKIELINELKKEVEQRDKFFVYSNTTGIVQQVTARQADRDWRHTDVNDDVFVVKAASREEALDIANEWVRVRSDDDINDMGDLAFIERDPHRRDCRAYTILVRL